MHVNVPEIPSDSTNANTNTVIPNVHRDLTSAYAIVPDIRNDVVNTRVVVSDVRCNTLKNREDMDGQIQAAGNTRALPVAKRSPTAAQAHSRSATSTSRFGI